MALTGGDMTDHTFTPEDTAEHLRGLQASADLIDALIAAGVKDAETRDTMDRNVRHIGIMCAMPHLQECGADLTPYTDAAHRGAAWLA
jgi:hypothetical protein